MTRHSPGGNRFFLAPPVINYKRFPPGECLVTMGESEISLPVMANSKKFSLKIFQNFFFLGVKGQIWSKIQNFKFCWKWSQTCCFDMKRVLKLKKVEKSRFKNFRNFSPKPQALRRYFGEKTKILNFAGNGLKHVVLT